MTESKAKTAIESAQFAQQLDAALAAKDSGALAKLGEFDLSKAQRKELGRAVHRLRSAGIEVELPAEEKATPAAVREEPALDCLATSIDGSGGRMMWLFADAAEGGREAVACYVSDTEGIKLIQLAASGRKRANEIRRDLLRSKQVPVVRLSGGHARTLIEEAEALTRELGHALPDGFAALHEMVRKLPPAISLEPHPAKALARKLDEREMLAFARGSASLLEEHPFRGWGPDKETGRELTAKIENVLTSTVIISPAQRIEQLERTFQQAAADALEGEGKARWVRRLRDAAHALHGRGYADIGEQAATLAEAIEQLPEVPAFLVALLRRPFEELFTAQRAALSGGVEGGKIGEGGPETPKSKLIIPGR
ncbi:MAG: hypothetical protein KDH09_18385 [Chrysiogenetes bacterium]|nr:hypothetical protein [Chrysiogenetes bacterium]